MKQAVPFYANIDSTHCYQACLRMIMKYFYPQREYSWQELRQASAKAEGLWTWPMAGMVWLQQSGLELLNVEDFDYERFITEGEEYLIERSGETVARKQIEHSDIEQEYHYARELLKNITTEARVPSQAELKQKLDGGDLVVCNVNSHTLAGREGYVGHFVLLIDYDDKGFTLHNPGPPGIEAQHVTSDVFEKAWAYPNENAKNYFAVNNKSGDKYGTSMAKTITA